MVGGRSVDDDGRVDLDGADVGRSVEHWFVLGVALVVPVVLGLMGLCFEPDARGFGTHEQLGVKPCMTMDLWGIPCPGCGVTTSVTMAVQGRLWDSFATQPFGFALALGAVGFVAWALWGQFTGRDLYRRLLAFDRVRWGAALVAIVLASWIYKLARVG